ncbi:MAG: ubiquinone/menaquinone biosynthesis protein [Nitrospira sp.]|nr:ubiquinone/menaquinone biosynthesis protein [Nitrospira sp.]
MHQRKTAASLEPPTCDDLLIWDTWMSVFHFPTLTVADELGLFTYLDKAPASAEEVAKHFALSPRATESLLGVLSSLGFVSQRGGTFYVTEVTRNFLLPESPYYWGGLLQLVRNIPFTHSSILDALKKDQPIGYEGKDVWETHEINPEQARAFTAAMHSHLFSAATGVARHGNFSGVKKFLDIGGGSACFPIALAQRYPDMRFTIMELPVACTLAESYAADFGLADRIDTMAVDLFRDAWPTGYDAVFFSNIFHDWDWKRCRHLAAQSFQILPSGGRIYLHEMLLADTKDAPLTATSFSMNMMFFTLGKQFTAAELEALLKEAGFHEISIVQTYGYYSLVSGRKP